MKRIWNALRYGDAETRKCIGSVILFSLLALVFIVISALNGHIYLFMLGMMFGVVAIIVSQTFTLVDDDFVAEVNKAGDKNTVKTVSVKKNGAKTISNNEKKKEEKKPEPLEEEEKKKPEPPKEKEEIAEHGKPAKFDHYSEKMLKQVKKKYNVKKDHRPIVIDSSKSYNIKECPAFIWRVHNKVYLLLIEEEPRRISISRDLIRNMGYLPNVKADKSKEYLAFQKENIVTRVFREFLPEYHNSKERGDKSKYKNLYVIYPDIRIPNRSAGDVKELLYLNFMPEDKITKSEKINGFFKKIYAANILYKDKVYTITEYKEEVEKVLSDLCYAEIPDWEFKLTLENLVNGKLISQQYADYYIEHHEDIQAKRAGKKAD